MPPTKPAARDVVDVVDARTANALLRAPTAGAIRITVPQIGEAVTLGEPIMTLPPDRGVRFGCNLPEDALAGFCSGARVPAARADAADTVRGTVTDLRNRGEFATWRAARASGDHNPNTFFVRVDPVTPDPTPAPGQTVWLNQTRGP